MLRRFEEQYFRDEWSYSFKGTYGWRYFLTNFFYMFCPWKVFVNKQAQRFSFFDFLDRFPIDLNIDLIIQ